ncbi:LmbE family N-acetylglucosaminyl deacetylase [Naumannella halotolerans]|uniref:LmbE family N-acetylglucosaminyl deacetylase n=2 Tax=Naumannella halotolerans TaxID=993414 RepID=A0A4V3EN98_9ACTN|nr:LmbE family N-acetylglucosaminyl deacetylase [Naumannella halotolerans]
MFLGALRSIALLGAHCDDIAIGAGATLDQLCRAHPGVRVDALVLSGAGTPREQEEHSALTAFCPGAELNLRVDALPDGRQPAAWESAKSAVAEFRRAVEPDLVIGPQRGDAHQDHRQLAELISQEFRDHLVLGYEIPKYEGDLPNVNAYVPVTQDSKERKVELLHRHYPSQHDRTWFDADTFSGLMRVRGVQSQTRWAEAFVAEKLLIEIPAVDPSKIVEARNI